MERLKKERTQHTNRIRGLLATHGIKVKNVRHVAWDHLRDWEGKPLGVDLIRELKRECGRLELVDDQVEQLESERDDALKGAETKAEKLAAKTKVIQRFSEEYFKLVREVSGEKGKVLASQAAGEELMLEHDDTVYHIK